MDTLRINIYHVDKIKTKQITCGNLQYGTS